MTTKQPGRSNLLVAIGALPFAIWAAVDGSTWFAMLLAFGSGMNLVFWFAHSRWMRP